MLDVTLVSMPFGNIFAPSLGLGLLKGGLERGGLASRILYFTIQFAELVGPRFYSDIADAVAPSVRQLPGEWLFSSALFGTPLDDERYVNTILGQASGWIASVTERPVSPGRIARLRRARARVDGFVERCAEQVLRTRPRIVGFTSVFQQHVASLALAKRLKAAAPEVFIVFGGANCEGVMGAETVRQFEFVDAAVSGEADVVFPELVRRVLAGVPIEGLPGVRTRASIAAEFASGRFSNGTPVTDMDALPYPDYRDYFEQFEACRFHADWQPRILFESSRGCWWGEKQHCTFCGLNGATMTFRSKSAPRVLQELSDLTRAHPGCEIQVADNILDLRYFGSVLPELAARNKPAKLFYETKSNLKKDQVRLLAQSGVGEIQPGIESFSDSVLALMRKGVTGLQNIQLLKWCQELGVKPYWNVLWGFPGEAPEEYASMARLVPLLTHLQPPGGFEGIRLDRFSPNFAQAERLGFADVEPLPAYREVYPLAPQAVANLAYHFTFRYPDGRDVDAYVRPLLRELRRWKACHARSALSCADDGARLVICDQRPCATAAFWVLSDSRAELYRMCDAITEVRALAERLSLAVDTVEQHLEPLVAAGLIVRRGTKCLALAVPLGTASRDERLTQPFLAAARRLGRVAEGVLRVDLRRVNGDFGLLRSFDPRRTLRRPAGRGSARATRRREPSFSLEVEPEALLVRLEGRPT